MSTTLTDRWPASAHRYVERVAKALTGVDPDERDDLLEDLRAHVDALIEVEEVAHGSAERIRLQQQLGTPEAYAAELLESAGLGRRTSRSPRGWLRDRAEQVLAPLRSPRATAVRHWLDQLRPVVWVARGYGLALLLAVLTGSGQPQRLVPIPWLLGHPLVGTLVTIGLIYVSVEIGAGRMLAAHRRALLARGMGLLAVVGLLSAWGAVTDYTDYRAAIHEDVPRSAVVSVEPPVPLALQLPGGEPVTNIYAFDSDGNPLEGVLLYDGAGNPIALQATPDGRGYPFDAFGLATDYARDANGQIVPNLYPLTQYRRDAPSVVDGLLDDDGAPPPDRDTPALAQDWMRPAPAVRIPPLHPAAPAQGAEDGR